MRECGIGADKTVLIGDSGGDGPHFGWGKKVSAFLIGSMTKSSLDQYCSQRGIKLNLYLDPRYSEGDKRNQEMEMKANFTDLIPKTKAIL